VSKADCEAYLARAERHIAKCYRFVGQGELDRANELADRLLERIMMDMIWRNICDRLLDLADERKPKVDRRRKSEHHGKRSA